jgi:hypothetical protein
MIVEVLVESWRKWTTPASALSDLNCCAEGEVGRMARELGMSASELRSLARQGPDADGLLSQRMAALGLDQNVIVQTEPATLQDLQRLCTMCDSKKQCARDLSRDPTDPEWEDYCPNVGTLKVLDVMQFTSRLV